MRKVVVRLHVVVRWGCVRAGGEVLPVAQVQFRRDAVRSVAQHVPQVESQGGTSGHVQLSSAVRSRRMGRQSEMTRERHDAASGKTAKFTLGKQRPDRAPRMGRRPRRFPCPLAGVPGVALVRRSFFYGVRPMAAHDPPEDWDRDLPPRPISDDLWGALVADLRLSPQQARIVDLIHRDLEYDEIAQRLGISERVVRDYLKRVCLRLGVRRRSGLVLYAYARSHVLRR